MERQGLRQHARLHPADRTRSPLRGDRGPVERGLRGVLQRVCEPHPVAALPLPHRPHPLRPRRLPGLHPGQPALRARTEAPAQGGRPAVGARLPSHRVRRRAAPDGGAADDGILLAHPFPFSGSAHRAAGARRPSSGALFAYDVLGFQSESDRRSFLDFVTTEAGGRSDPEGRGARVRSTGGYRGVSHRHRFVGVRALRGLQRGEDARQPHGESAARPPGRDRRGPPRLHQGAARALPGIRPLPGGLPGEPRPRELRAARSALAGGRTGVRGHPPRARGPRRLHQRGVLGVRLDPAALHQPQLLAPGRWPASSVSLGSASSRRCATA